MTYIVTITDKGRVVHEYEDTLADNEADVRDHARKVASHLGASIWATITVVLKS